MICHTHHRVSCIDSTNYKGYHSVVHPTKSVIHCLHTFPAYEKQGRQTSQTRRDRSTSPQTGRDRSRAPKERFVFNNRWMQHLNDIEFPIPEGGKKSFYLTSLTLRGLPLIRCAPRGRGGGGQVSYTFPFHITW